MVVLPLVLVVVVAGVVVVGVVVVVVVETDRNEMAPVGSDVATVDPFLFEAVNVTRNFEPTSAAVSSQVGCTAPVIALHAVPRVSHRCH